LIWPSFNSHFLNEVTRVIKKRSKSTKKKVSSFIIQKVIEKEGDSEFEKLEIELVISVNRATIRLFFWEDRFVWIDSRLLSKKGWQAEWTTEGRVGELDIDNFQEAFERSLLSW